MTAAGLEQSRFERAGIDAAELLAIRSAVESDPASGQCRFRVDNEWQGGRRSKAVVVDLDMGGRTYQRSAPAVVEADAPRALHGEERGASPLEYALTALLSCLTTTLVAQAALHGIELRAVETKAEGDLDLRGFLGLSDAVRKGFGEVRVVFRIDADVPARELAVLVRAAMQNSPMVDLFRNGTRVIAESTAG